MKVKLITILNSAQAFQKLLNSDKLPISTAYKVSKLSKQIINEAQQFEETRKMLIEKYGEDKLSEADSELKEILETEVEISAPKLKLNQLEQAGLTPFDLLLLEEFVEE